MGKKPVIGLVGVCWITLAFSAGNGCNCCNRQYNPKPAWGKGFDGKPVNGPAASPDGTPAATPVPNQQTPAATPPPGASGSQGFSKPPQSSQQGALPATENDMGARVSMNTAQSNGNETAIRLTGATVPASTDPSVSSISSRPSYDVPSGLGTSLPVTRTTSLPTSSNTSSFRGQDDLNGRGVALPPPPAPLKPLPPSTNPLPALGAGSGSGGSGSAGFNTISESMIPVPPANPVPPTALPTPMGAGQRGLPNSPAGEQ